MTSDCLRVAVVGFGAMGRRHALTLARLPDCELAAVVATPVDAEHVPHGTVVLSNVSDLGALTLDYAVVALPATLHEPAAIKLARMAIPTLIEKPLAADHESAERIAAAFRRSTTFAAVGYIERFCQAINACRQQIAGGEHGAVRHISTVRRTLSAHITDVGAGLDLLSHDIDLTRWLTTNEYQSMTATKVTQGQHGEDAVTMSGILSDGTPTHHVAARSAAVSQRMCTVTCERGTLVADTARDTLRWRPGVTTIDLTDASRSRLNKTQVVPIADDSADPLTREHRAFHDALQTGRRGSLASLEESAETVALITRAIAKSANHCFTVAALDPAASGRPL